MKYVARAAGDRQRKLALTPCLDGAFTTPLADVSEQ